MTPAALMGGVSARETTVHELSSAILLLPQPPDYCCAHSDMFTTQCTCPAGYGGGMSEDADYGSDCHSIRRLVVFDNLSYN